MKKQSNKRGTLRSFLRQCKLKSKHSPKNVWELSKCLHKLFEKLFFGYFETEFSNRHCCLPLTRKCCNISFCKQFHVIEFEKPLGTVKNVHSTCLSTCLETFLNSFPDFLSFMPQHTMHVACHHVMQAKTKKNEYVYSLYVFFCSTFFKNKEA